MAFHGDGFDPPAVPFQEIGMDEKGGEVPPPGLDVHTGYGTGEHRPAVGFAEEHVAIEANVINPVGVGRELD